METRNLSNEQLFSVVGGKKKAMKKTPKSNAKGGKSKSAAGKK